MVGAELLAFLEGGCALIAGTVRADGVPFATRGWGLVRLGREDDCVRILLPAGDLVDLDLTQDAQGHFPLAVTGADVRTLRSVQAKGLARDLADADRADHALCRRYCDEFFDAVVDVDEQPRAQLERMVPVDLVACTFTIVEVYDQTPGPGAGASLSHPEAP